MKYLANIPLHPKTTKQVELFLQRPTSSLLILGGAGVGKVHIADFLALDLLGLKHQADLANYPYFFRVRREMAKQDISINIIRDIIKFLRLKTPGARGIRRVVLIENAQHLSVEAQNALLKVLEEPNDDTAFLLTAPYELSLLPTIVSRCQQIQVHPITLKQAASFYGNRFTARELESAWQLSQGHAALLDALLTDDNVHPLKQAVEQAKEFIKLNRYQRLLLLDSLAKDRDGFKLFLDALNKVLSALHRTSINKGNLKQVRKVLKDRQLVRRTELCLENNGNAKLICLDLVHNLNL